MSTPGSLLIRNGRVIDPANQVDAIADVLIEGTTISASAEAARGRRTVDATGKVVCPGLIDIHVHLREPASSTRRRPHGTRAAARAASPRLHDANTQPSTTTDRSPIHLDKARTEGRVRVYAIGAVTRGLRGRSCRARRAGRSGCVAFSDDVSA